MQYQNEIARVLLGLVLVAVLWHHANLNVCPRSFAHDHDEVPRLFCGRIGFHGAVCLQ